MCASPVRSSLTCRSPSPLLAIGPPLNAVSAATTGPELSSQDAMDHRGGHAGNEGEPGDDMREIVGDRYRGLYDLQSVTRLSLLLTGCETPTRRPGVRNVGPDDLARVYSGQG